MRRFPAILARAGHRLVEHPFLLGATERFSARVAVMAVCFFLIGATAIRQMDGAYRQAIVKEGRYSLVETGARPWHALDLRVGWTKNGAYVGLADYAALETFSLGRFSLSFFAFLTPSAWCALAALGSIRARAAEPVSTEGDAPAPQAEGAMLAPPLAGLQRS